MSKRVKFSPEVFPTDVFMSILTKLDLTDLFRYRSLSKKWQNILSLDNWPRLYKQLTGKEFQWIQYALLTNLDKNWNWQRLTENPGITIEFMERYPDIGPWSEEYVSGNPNVDMQYILDNPQREWFPGHYSDNSSITFQDVLDHPELEWDFSALMNNPNVTYQDVLDHPELDWDYECLHLISSITVDEYMNHPDIDPYMVENLEKITMQDIIKYEAYMAPDVLKKAIVTMEDIRKHRKLFIKEQLECLCANGCFTIPEVTSSDLFEINNAYLAKHPGMTYAKFQKYQAEKDLLPAFCENPGIKLRDVIEHPEHDWDWFKISTKIN